MTKTNKIIYSAFILIVLAFIWYVALTQPKVKAWNDLLKSQERISELEDIIEDAQFRRAIAETSKAECIQSRDDQKVKAHDDAEKARIEIKELQGFLMNR